MTRLYTIALGLFLTTALVLVVGCSDSGKTGTQKGTQVSEKVHKHEHPEEGPHNGALAEWGDAEFHAEFTVNHEKKEARVYILGPDRKNQLLSKPARLCCPSRTQRFR